jgi:hypothetical protein
VIPAALAQDGAPPSAKAVGYAALLPGGTQGAVSATASGPTERTAAVGGLRPAGGGSVGAVRVDVRASSAGTAATAEGTVEVYGVSLLDGRVSIAALRMSARTVSGARAGEAGLTAGSVSGLVVDGVPRTAGLGGRVDVPGVGTLVFLEQVADGAGGVQANGMRLEVTDPQAAAVIGQPFVLGHLDLGATAGTAAAQPPPSTAPLPTATAPATQAAGGATVSGPLATTAMAPESATTAPLVTTAPLGLPRRAAPAVGIAADGGYVFPVFGDVGFGDDYGAPRAGTGWHHGNDIFAPRGTPVLAVADGTLSKVGVNTLGGNRLWLTDDAGNSFYYAHLSAYAPAAVEGARVSAGQVIAFVGNTGQAITTPPHLHFEVHPGGGDSVDPYPYLVAWQRGSDIPRAFTQAAISASPAPAVGAVLVDGVPELDTAPAPADGLATPAT